MSPPGAGTPAGLPDVDTALPWRSWAEGADEARARRAPLLCFAEPAWSNAAQRLALVLGRDRDAAATAADRFVPVRLDALARPDLAASLRGASVALTGSAGPPLLALLTPEGLPFLAYPTIRPEGDDEHPSLGALLRTAADLHDERPDAVRDEAEALRARKLAAPLRSWDAVADRADAHHGGLRGLPKTPEPALLWRLLDAAEVPKVRDHLLRTLDGLRRGGILDQLGGSFHRASRDERWIVPHFEKPVPLNAALAAVFARAAEQFGREEFADVATTAARFAVAGLDEGVMVLASEPGYYTWTPGQFQEALDAELVSALGLHVNMTRHDSPHTLFRHLEPEAMAERSHQPADLLRDRIEVAKERLRFARMQRPAPAAVAIDAPAWHAETLRWCFRALEAGVELDRSALLAHLDALLARPYDPETGYGRTTGEGDVAHWLEDQAAIAAAGLEAFRVCDHRPALDAARRLADLIVNAYRTPGAERLTDRPARRSDAAASRSLVDHDLPAAVPTAVETLRDLARLGGERAEAWTRAADGLAAAYRPGSEPSRGSDAAAGSPSTPTLGKA